MRELVSAQQRLDQGLSPLGLSAISAPLMQYLVLLHKWNTAYNLTAIRDLDSMVSKHLFDSLAIMPWIQGKRVLDVGTGAGLPGIPLALAQPDKHFTLLDSNGKKIRFLNEVARQLNLNNLEIIHSRAKTYHSTEHFDTVLSRALSSIVQLIDWTCHLIAPNGIWLAMKGQVPESELRAIHQPYQIKHYTVEGIDATRCCVVVGNKES